VGKDIESNLEARVDEHFAINKMPDIDDSNKPNMAQLSWALEGNPLHSSHSE